LPTPSADLLATTRSVAVVGAHLGGLPLNFQLAERSASRGTI
jgi:hypothetical protein